MFKFSWCPILIVLACFTAIDANAADVTPALQRDRASLGEIKSVSSWGKSSHGLQIGVGCDASGNGKRHVTVILGLRNTSNAEIMYQNDRFYESAGFSFSATTVDGRSIEENDGRQSLDYNSVSTEKPFKSGLTLQPGDAVFSKRDISDFFQYPSTGLIRIQARRTIYFGLRKTDRLGSVELLSGDCTVL